MGEWIGVKYIPCAFGRRPEREMKVGKAGQQINFIFVVQKNKIVAYGGILAVYGENVAKKVQNRPAEHGYGEKKS